jgi:hypothetical protein
MASKSWGGEQHDAICHREQPAALPAGPRALLLWSHTIIAIIANFAQEPTAVCAVVSPRFPSTAVESRTAADTRCGKKEVRSARTHRA